jgi:hypothetical protein
VKINVIGMILNNAGRRSFDGAVLGDAGRPMSAADSLHTLIMEYAKAFNGGESKIAALSREVSAQAPAAEPLADKMMAEARAECGDDMLMRGIFVSGWLGAERAHGIGAA